MTFRKNDNTKNRKIKKQPLKNFASDVLTEKLANTINAFLAAGIYSN